MDRVKMLWEGLKERADKLRQSSDDLKKQAETRSAELPKLALAAHEDEPGGAKAFSDAVDEVDRLILEARRAQFAAAALDEKAEETRKEDIEFERNARVREMSDDRTAYDHAVKEMDAALKNLEDAYIVLNDARKDFIGSLRRAGFDDAGALLQRRAQRFLQAAIWAQAPILARGLGIERTFVHYAKPLAESGGFLPEPKEATQ